MIYLPAGMKEEERQHVLAHEYQHVRRRDYLIKPVCFLAVLLHWFKDVYKRQVITLIQLKFYYRNDKDKELAG